MVSEPESKGRRYIEKIIEALAIAGWTAVVVMMVWGTADVVAQSFGYSLPATVPWTEIFNVIALTLPLTYVTSKKTHVVVSLFTIRGNAKRVTDFMAVVLVFLFTALLAWQLSISAWRSVRFWEFDQVTIKVYWFPAKIALALGYGGSALVAMSQVINQLGRRNIG